MKPPQKLKRLLRVKVARSIEQGQEQLKIFGYLYPRREETAAVKFTSFFRQVTLVSEKDKSTLETVSYDLNSGKSQQATSKNVTVLLFACQTHQIKGFQFI